MGKETPEDRRNEILLAALQAFTEKGYDKTSMDDIVRASGLSKGTLYWYFKGKQELFSAVVLMVTQEIMTAIGDMMTHDMHLPASEHLLNIVRVSNEQLKENPHFVSLMPDFFTQAWQFETVQKVFADYYVQYINAVAVIIQQGIDGGQFRSVDPHQAAAAFIGSLDGIMLQVLLEPERDIVAISELWAEIFVKGLRHDG